MKVTLEQLEEIVSTMKNENVTEINLDIDSYCDSCERVDFDIWNNNGFERTILTINND